MRHVVVVGSGAAGTAAALEAAKQGARVTMVLGDPGASVLSGGALDHILWERYGALPHPLYEEIQAPLDALGSYVGRESYAFLASTTGIVRRARCIDRALLDLRSAADGTILVAGVAHGTWDPEALARAWGASLHARVGRLRFVVAPVEMLQLSEERAFTDAELAARHDDPERLSWLARRIRLAVSGHSEPIAAVVLPRWLGVEQERATELSRLVGVPCGEALGGSGGPSGLRFERARDRALRAAGVTCIAGRATSVSQDGRRVKLERGEGVEADAVVLATGGLIGGGLEYTPSDAYEAGALPETPRASVRVTLDAPLRIGAGGKEQREPSSLFGASPELLAWPHAERPLLDRIGVLVDEEGRSVAAPSAIFAAGELVADQPRTFLSALASGAVAGRAAAR